jgi:hypothetical protein
VLGAHLFLSFALAAALVLGQPAAPLTQAGAGVDVCAIQTTERIVAVGDVHGAFDKFTAILREAGLIDSRRRWTGGRAILVQTGDVLDRGAESRQVLDLLRKLEGEATKAGGQVHALLGNHEAMRIMGVMRDVSPREIAAFRTTNSQELLDQYFEAIVQQQIEQARAAKQEFDAAAFRTRFYDDNPPGAIEMHIAFGPKGDYGRWLRTRNTMTKINGIVFMHGGLSPALTTIGCAELNQRVRAELDTVRPTDANLQTTLIAGPDGPLWYRGYFADPPPAPEVMQGVLDALGATAIVVGHTPPPGFTITPSFSSRVFQIDTGMLNGEFFPGGRPSALEIQGGTFTAIYEGKKRDVLVKAAGSLTDR